MSPCLPTEGSLQVERADQTSLAPDPSYDFPTQTYLGCAPDPSPAPVPD